MKKADVKVGGVYWAKVSEKLAAVKVTSERPGLGWGAENLKTGKTIMVRSAQRFRAPVTRVEAERLGVVTGRAVTDALDALDRASSAHPLNGVMPEHIIGTHADCGGVVYYGATPAHGWRRCDRCGADSRRGESPVLARESAPAVVPPPAITLVVAPPPAGKSEAAEPLTEDEWETWFMKAHRDGCAPDGMPLSQRVHDEVFHAYWNIQDGYGEPGLTPPQGYDWSGIRDSSDAAKRRMIAAARVIFERAGIPC